MSNMQRALDHVTQVLNQQLTRNDTLERLQEILSSTSTSHPPPTDAASADDGHGDDPTELLPPSPSTLRSTTSSPTPSAVEPTPARRQLAPRPPAANKACTPDLSMAELFETVKVALDQDAGKNIEHFVRKEFMDVLQLIPYDDADWQPESSAFGPQPNGSYVFQPGGKQVLKVERMGRIRLPILKVSSFVIVTFFLAFVFMVTFVWNREIFIVFPYAVSLLQLSVHSIFNVINSCKIIQT